MINLSKVDLPHPLGPISTVVLLRSIERLVECNASVPAYRLLTFTSRTSALIGVATALDRGRDQRSRLEVK